MRLRKRVILMVVIVSVIFGVCWGVDFIVYILRIFVFYNIGFMIVVVI